HHAQVHLHHARHHRHDPVQARAPGAVVLAEEKDHARFVLLDDLQPRDEPEAENRQKNDDAEAHVSSALMSRVRPRTDITRARVPGGSCELVFHSSPATSMVPSSRISPTTPMSDSPPVSSRLRTLFEKFHAN